jgi:hypothetical protein
MLLIDNTATRIAKLLSGGKSMACRACNWNEGTRKNI